MNKNDATFLIKNEKNNLEVRNYQKTGDTKLLHIYKLEDFFSNNIDFELNKISILHLDNCEISGIAQNIQKLNLRQLILTRNKLKEVPSCLYSGLKTLELLDLSQNLIKSFDIEPACSCTIVSLKLNDNQVHNLPHWILTLRCPKLKEVVYSNNGVVELKASHELNIENLEMCNCNLLDYDFQFFKGIKTLECLDISNQFSNGKNENRFKDLNLLFLKPKWTRLSILKLNNLCISILPQNLFSIVSLKELYLVNCDLSWISGCIQYLVNLEILDVSHNMICSLPQELSLLDKLIIIKAPFNNISSIAEFNHSLEILDLYDNYLDAYPKCVEKTKLIDLEQNLFDTYTDNYSDYMKKREDLRLTVDSIRINGPRVEIINHEPEIFPSNSSTDTEPEEYIYDDRVLTVDQSLDSDFENWDEEEPKVIKVISTEKNPEITASDDEWDGKENSNKYKEKPSQFCEYDVNEEWIFCDVEA